MIAKQVTAPRFFAADIDDRSAAGDRHDDGLMARVASDDEAAFGRLVTRHRTWLTDWCTRLTGDHDAGGEVAHEVFIRLWEQRRSYRPQGKLKGLLTALARNTAYNRQRAARRRAHWHQQHRDHRQADDADQLSALLVRERRSMLRRQVDRLPHKQREALQYRFTQDLNYAEIAAIVGRPEATIRSRVHNGLQRLRALLVAAAIVLAVALVFRSDPDSGPLSSAPVAAPAIEAETTVQREQSFAYPVWAVNEHPSADVTSSVFEVVPVRASTTNMSNDCQCRVSAPELYPL